MKRSNSWMLLLSMAANLLTTTHACSISLRSYVVDNTNLTAAVEAELVERDCQRSSVTFLMINRHKALTSLPEDVFAGMTSLTYLYLIDNALTSLPEDVFANLPQLEELSLSNNALTALPEGVFAGLPLRKLTLTDNALTSLPVGVFAGLTSLKTLVLSDNALTSLSEDVFAGLPYLNYLTLNKNALTSLPEGVFAGLPYLDTLKLSYNALTSLPEGVFAGLSTLLQLYLEHNALTSLSGGVFAGMTSLTTLTLNNNALTSLSEDVFAGLSALPYLNLNNNALTSLPGGVFAGMTSLRGQLNLSNNALTSLPEGVFAGMTDLRRLYLHNNTLTSLSGDVFAGMTSLTTLYLSNNALTSLSEDVFAGLARGNFDLHLDNNALTSLPAGIFAGFGEYLHLNLGYNALTSLPVGIFDGVHTAQVFLRDNPLTSLPEGCFANSRLGHLNVDNTLLTTLPADVFPDNNQFQLFMRNCSSFASLPADVFADVNLVNVFITGSVLTSLPDGVFAGQNKLGYVDLSNNALTAIPANAFYNLPELTSVDLTNNPLTAIAANAFYNLPELTSVKLDDAWWCDPDTDTLCYGHCELKDSTLYFRADSAAPTTHPTDAPTVVPTTEPTANPTTVPTAAPTTKYHQYYTVKKNGDRCANGWAPVMTESECREAVVGLGEHTKNKGHTWKGTDKFDDRVAGCFEGGIFRGDGDGNVYFNTLQVHQEKSNPKRHRICGKTRSPTAVATPAPTGTPTATPTDECELSLEAQRPSQFSGLKGKGKQEGQKGSGRRLPFQDLGFETMQCTRAQMRKKRHEAFKALASEMRTSGADRPTWKQTLGVAAMPQKFLNKASSFGLVDLSVRSAKKKTKKNESGNVQCEEADVDLKDPGAYDVMLESEGDEALACVVTRPVCKLVKQAGTAYDKYCWSGSPTSGSWGAAETIYEGSEYTCPGHRFEFYVESMAVVSDGGTGAPTANPTTSPTVAPTGTPTDAPTTLQSTNAPTVVPTDAPTVVPTDAPTGASTTPPTPEPTSAPTDNPTVYWAVSLSEQSTFSVEWYKSGDNVYKTYGDTWYINQASLRRAFSIVTEVPGEGTLTPVTGNFNTTDGMWEPTSSGYKFSYGGGEKGWHELQGHCKC